MREHDDHAKIESSASQAKESLRVRIYPFEVD